MFWNRKKLLNSKEYEDLLTLINKLRIDLEYLKLELQMYVKKLRASKGIKDFEEKEKEEFINKVLLPP